MIIRLPYLLFVGSEPIESNAKTAFGLKQWRPEACAAQWRLSENAVDLGLPNCNPKQAKDIGAQSLLIGVAPIGGQINVDWIAPIVLALKSGLDIVSGMHTKLESVPEIAAAAAQSGRQLINVRHPTRAFACASGVKRTGMRLLMVGTDCALGKKYTALALTNAMTRAGVKATFRATGQTGLMIAGEGIAIDAIVADFIAGAAEALSPDNEADHWDIIEGQGSLLHPAYAGVSLGLLHGSQPDVIILCHDPRRFETEDFPGYKIPDLKSVIDLHLLMGRLTNPNVTCAAISLNTHGMTAQQRIEAIDSTQRRYNLPTFDPLISELSPIVRAVLFRNSACGDSA